MSKKFQWRRIAIFLLLCCRLPLCHAVDGISIDLLSGNDSSLSQIGLQWDWQHKWFETRQILLGGYWDVSFAHWNNKRFANHPEQHQHINDVGITAAFRLRRNHEGRAGFYTEFGTGPHWLSEHYDNNGRYQASKFVFESYFGVGFVWNNGIELNTKVMHMSNGGLAEPNSAVNLAGVGLRWWW